MKTLFLLTCCLILLSNVANAAPTNVSIQIADTQTAGVWQWRNLTDITWDAAVTPSPFPQSTNVDDDSKQEWLIPHSSGVWGFHFILGTLTTQAKEYALRWGYTTKDSLVPVLYSDYVTVTIAIPNSAVKVD